VKKARIVSLCHACQACPVVKIDEEHVEIGEKDNICILTKKEWEVLKENRKDPKAARKGDDRDD
jgi:hypothetical protein